MSAPLVSIAICTYNSSRYIDETLESVFAQTVQDFELIVVDDGSTDGTPDHIERRYADPRLRLVRQRNQTLRVARPAAVARARGEFLAFLDHDDVWLPDKLQRQLAAARTHVDAALVFSDCLIVDASGASIGRISDQFDFEAIDLDGCAGYLELLRRGCFVAYSTAFARTAAVRRAGGFDARYQYVSDYELWLRLARRAPVHCVREPLAKYRVHATQFTQQHCDVTLREHEALLRPIQTSASCPADVQAALAAMLFGQHRVVFRQLVRQRRYGAAARAAAGAVRYPTQLRAYARHRLATTPIGPSVRALLRISRGATRNTPLNAAVPRAPTTTSSRSVWIDGTPLAGAQTGYFNLVAEVIRRLARDASVSELHVTTDRRGRAALLARLEGDVERVQCHRAGWRVLHWTQIYELIFDWPGHMLAALVCLGTLMTAALTMPAIAIVPIALLVCQGAVLIDELHARVVERSGRARERLTRRMVRFLWRRMPAPRWRAPNADTVEVLVWRGHFRYRDAHRVAIVQDMTPRLVPELHTQGNVAEFGEYLGYVQRHAHAIATVSHQSRDDILDALPVCPECVSVIPMPVHPQYERPSFTSGHPAAHGIQGPYVLAVGTIEPRKNLRRLVQAFERLRCDAAADDHELVLTGPSGWDPDFQLFLARTDASRRVRLTGFVPLEHLPSLYHFASAVVCPSVYEGFGLPVLEAMCASAVVLASCTSALPEVLGFDGILFDPCDTKDMARALLGALRLPPAEAARYRARCRRRAEEHLQRLALEPPLPGFAARNAVQST